MVLQLVCLKSLQMSRENKGISLVEIVCTVAILSTSSLMIISCFHGVSQIKATNNVNSNMQLVCQNFYEELRTKGIADLDTYTDPNLIDNLELSIEKYDQEIDAVTGDSVPCYKLVFESQYLGEDEKKEYYFMANLQDSDESVDTSLPGDTGVSYE